MSKFKLEDFGIQGSKKQGRLRLCFGLLDFDRRSLRSEKVNRVQGWFAVAIFDPAAGYHAAGQLSTVRIAK
jgi:hypothetical protein